MDKILNSVSEPNKFRSKLEKVIFGINNLFELAREHEYDPKGEFGQSEYIASSYYEREIEFMQTILDIIRLYYEPNQISSFCLNSEIDIFLLDEIPQSPFKLGYASMISTNNQKFCTFWKEKFLPHLKQCDYDIEKATSAYAIASTGKNRYKSSFLHEVAKTLNSGFSVAEVTQSISSSINDGVKPLRKKIYSGYCLDPALEEKIRLSVWLFLPKSEDNFFSYLGCWERYCIGREKNSG